MNEPSNEALSQLEVAVTITKRGTASKVLEITHSLGSIGGTVLPGRGTAKSSILDLLGMEKDREYEVFIVDIPKVKRNDIIKKVTEGLKLMAPGNGIMFTMPSLGISGLKLLRQILEEKGIVLPVCDAGQQEEETKNMGDTGFALIISVVHRGYADDAMDAAREVGAKGGIILNGRGAGFSTAEKFLGISIEHEREILLNLVEKDKVRDILEALVQKAGIKTEARGISFVLPVNQAMGVVKAHDEIAANAVKAADKENETTVEKK